MGVSKKGREGSLWVMEMFSDLTEAGAPWLHLSKLVKNALSVYRSTHPSGIVTHSSVDGHMSVCVCVCVRVHVKLNHWAVYLETNLTS